MNNLKIEYYATYVEEVDCTIVWQYMYFGDDTAADNHEPIQTAIVGWYHGEPNDNDTKHYSNSTVIATYC